MSTSLRFRSITSINIPLKDDRVRNYWYIYRVEEFNKLFNQ